MNQNRPIICTFYALKRSLQAVHQDNKADVDRLHDVWKRLAPVPSARIMQPKIYDERVDQRKQGNIEKRIVAPEHLAEWIKDCLQSKGFDITPEQAMVLVDPIKQRWG